MLACTYTAFSHITGDTSSEQLKGNYTQKLLYSLYIIFQWSINCGSCVSIFKATQCMVVEL